MVVKLLLKDTTELGTPNQPKLCGGSSSIIFESDCIKIPRVLVKSGARFYKLR